jgi:hypothetical protein
MKHHKMHDLSTLKCVFGVYSSEFKKLKDLLE